MFLKRTMPARNYKIRLFRTVCYKTELGYHFLQGKRKCKKKKNSVIQIFGYLNLSMERGTMAKEAPFSHSPALQETHFTTATWHWTLDVAKQKSMHQRLTSLNYCLFKELSSGAFFFSSSFHTSRVQHSRLDGMGNYSLVTVTCGTIP